MYKEYPKFYNYETLDYGRKSRTDDPLLSVEEVLDKHDKIIEEYAEKYLGGPIPEENKYREGGSAESLDSRPEILRLLKAVENPAIKAVAVVEVQRLSRGDLEDAGRLIRILRYTNTYVITPMKIYDLRDEYDRDAFERELKRGNEYLEYSKRIMENGRAISAENGNFLGNMTPYGYKRLKIKEGKRYVTTLEIVPEEAEIVREIYQMYADGIGPTSICRHLNQFSKPPRSNSWSRATITDILINPVYIGLIKWQGSKVIKTVENGEIVRRVQKRKEYPCFPGKHKPIISEELWNAAKARREACNIPRSKSTYNLINPFAGLIVCECGITMTFHKGPRGFGRLLCRNLACNVASCGYRDMKNIVADILRQSISDFELKIKSGEDDRSEEKTAFKKQLKKRLAALDDKEKNIWEKYIV